MPASNDSKFWFSLHGVLEQAIPSTVLTLSESNLLLFLGTRSIKWRRLWIQSSIKEIRGNGLYPYQFPFLKTTYFSAWRALLALKERETLTTIPEKLYGRTYFKINWQQLIQTIQHDLLQSSGSCMPSSVRKRYQRLGEILIFVNTIDRERRTPADENERLRRKKAQEDNSAFRQKARTAEGTASGS